MFPKKQNIVLNNLMKAYVEGIYNDSSLNRKLGRVGMSYREYINYLKEKGQYKESHREKREKNQIPINIGDLDFDKEGKARYEVNGKKIEIQLVSHIKHGEKNFTLKIDDKEYKDLNSTQLARKLKAIAGSKYDFTDSKSRMSDSLPWNKKDFEELYGDIGFNYTYYKDDLDIKVWIREDSKKEDPHFNIYVVDTKTKKKKSFTNLNLLEAHNKLLEFDLNPDIEEPLSKEQLKELRKIQKEQGIIAKSPYEVEPSKDIGIDFNEYGNAKFKINGGYCEFQVSRKNPSIINVTMLDEEGEVQGIDYTNVDNFKDFIADYNIEPKKEDQVDFYINSKGTNVMRSIKKPLNEVVENYPDSSSLYSLVSEVRYSPRYYIFKEYEDKLKKEIFDRKLGRFKNSYRDWNKGMREAYVFANSPAFINWLKDMPKSNQEGVTKRKIYNEIKELSNRFSGSGNIHGIKDLEDLQHYIIKKYY